jgi:hypothetical protein
VDSSTFFSLLVYAAVAAASPFSLLAFGLVLATDRGTRNGVAFIFGWITTVMLIGIAMAVLGDSYTVTPKNAPGAWTLALELALGVVVLIAWLRRRRSAPSEPTVAEAKPEPGWQRRITTMRTPGAFVLGGALQTWPVMIAAATELLRSDLGATARLTWMFVFAVATTTGIVVLEVLAVGTPGSARLRLDRMRTYIDDHRDAVVNYLYLLGGLWLFFRGLLGLLTR